MQHLRIDANQWAELNRLLDIALDLPPSERSRWLEALEDRYLSLKPQIAEFLQRAARIETQDFLNTLPKVGTGAAADDAPGDAIGRIASYGSWVPAAWVRCGSPSASMAR